MKQLRRKSVNLVKVQWSTDDRDCTWEMEESMRASNQELFVSGTIRYSYLIFLCFVPFRGRKDLSGGECNNPNIL